MKNIKELGLKVSFCYSIWRYINEVFLKDIRLNSHVVIEKWKSSSDAFTFHLAACDSRPSPSLGSISIVESIIMLVSHLCNFGGNSRSSKIGGLLIYEYSIAICWCFEVPHS